VRVRKNESGPVCGTFEKDTVVPIVSVTMNKVDGDELDDLQLGEVLLPPGRHAKGRDEIVVVHGDVHESVKDASDPLNRDVQMQTPPNEQECRGVVVDVKEDQLFLVTKREGESASNKKGICAYTNLFQNQNNGVKQLVNLGEVKDVDPIEQGTTVSLDVLSIAKECLPAECVALK
jgi:hypothetical protein